MPSEQLGESAQTPLHGTAERRATVLSTNARTDDHRVPIKPGDQLGDAGDRVGAIRVGDDEARNARLP